MQSTTYAVQWTACGSSAATRCDGTIRHQLGDNTAAHAVSGNTGSYATGCDK